MNDRRGSILVLVLFLASLLGVFAAIAAMSLHAATDVSRAYAEDVRAKEAMISAIEQIVARTGSGLAGSRGRAVIPLAKAQVTAMVRDESARIDLNFAPPELLTGIFRAVGVDAKAAESYAARIVDWRDPDDDLTPGGAERQAYRAAGRVDGPRNGPFLHVAELALVLGIPARAAAAVAPYVTVASGKETINPMIADPPVLLALPGVNQDRVQRFLQQRLRPEAEFDRLISGLGPVQNFVADENGNAVQIEGLVQLGPNNSRRFEVIVAVVDSDNEPYRILAWDSNPPERISAPMAPKESGL